MARVAAAATAAGLRLVLGAEGVVLLHKAVLQAQQVLQQRQTRLHPLREATQQTNTQPRNGTSCSPREERCMAPPVTQRQERPRGSGLQIKASHALMFVSFQEKAGKC